MYLKILSYIVSIIFLLGCSTQRSENKNNLLEYVDPLIGTDYHGHTFPGATTPFGMVQLSPDTRTQGWDACAGYHYSDSSIIGFSHTHLSGTGIGDYGDILMMPYTGSPILEPGEAENPDSGYRSRYRKSTQIASPGYYSVFLDDYGIIAELTAAKRAGFHQYTFPENSEAGIIIDLRHTIHKGNEPYGTLRIINEYEIEGLQKTKGWAQQHYTYFYAKFSKPFKYELFVDNKKTENNSVKGTGVKAKLSFETTGEEKVFVKVGISNVDTEGARKNLYHEICDWDFPATKSKAEEAWNKQLTKILVTDDNIEHKKVFYTALYHSNMCPTIYSDVDGRYRGMDQKIHESTTPNYTVFSLWDTYRAQHPLFTIIKPEYNQELIKALLRKYQEGGILPMWELASNYTGTMIGSHAVSVITDAYMKGYRDFDTKLALDACIEAMEYDSVKPIFYPNDDVKEKLMPRGKLYDVQFGYIPSDLERSSVSRGLEFAYNNWCIGQMAEDMGKSDIAGIFFERAQHYKSYFDKETGFMRGKNADGTWSEPFDPRHSDHWRTDYVEGNAWQWTWYVPHDVKGLIELFGGKEHFADKLDSLFTVTSELTGENISADITGLIGQYAHGNEPSHHIPYLFNYADRPWRTQEIVNHITTNFYSHHPDGLIGNEDAGQMSAWYILNAMGFYPVCPGSTQYSIGKPLFEKIEIPLGNGRTFTVKAEGLSETNIYVSKVLLNDQELTSPFIDHKDIIEGKKIVFFMDNKPGVFWNNLN